MQLEFFPLSKEEQLELEVEKLRLSSDKVRRKLFAQNSHLTKMFLELHNEFENLKRSICRMKKD